MISNMTQNFKTPQNFALPQKGIVVLNDDPRRLGRVKCVIAGLLEGRIDDLPWVYPWTGGESASSSSGKIPEIGSILVIEFPFRDIYSPFYKGAWKSYETATGLYNEDYPYSSGHRDEMGNQLVVSKSKGSYKFTHSSGSFYEFDAGRNFTLQLGGSLQLLSEFGKCSTVFDMSSGTFKFSGQLFEVSGVKTLVSSKELSIEVSSMVESVAGSKTSEIAGTSSYSVGGSHSDSVAGNYGMAVGGSSDSVFGGKQTNLYGLGREDTVVSGGLLETLIQGGKNVRVLLGDIEYSLLAGNYKVSVTAGNIEISTSLGTFKCGNALGSLEVDPSGSLTVKAVSKISMSSTGPISIQSGANIDLVAPMITLNKAAGGMVLTTLTEPVTDTISGKPSIGVPTVIAG
jgi:hypothetical protein